MPDTETSPDSGTADQDDASFDPLNRGRTFYRTDDHIGGVAGGIAEYFEIDPAIVRIGAAALVLSTGPAALAAYVAGWLFLPDATGSAIVGDPTSDTSTSTKDAS